MRRTVREQPRMVAARGAVVALLVAVGFVVGSLASGDSDGLARAEQGRTTLVRSLAVTRGQLRMSEERFTDAAQKLFRTRARLRTAERANRQIGRALRDARRSARRSRARQKR